MIDLGTIVLRLYGPYAQFSVPRVQLEHLPMADTVIFSELLL